MPWYSYIGGSVCGPNSYTLVGSNPPFCPTPKKFLCAIQANDSGGQPILTFALLCEIGNALQNRMDSTNVKLKP
ncbi:hypothetical protein LZQ00_06175 [Sphingobacterium sp. SRCM116780]|uniref:hypothetical protein n=1 Tax=Sphingobacterium sp. SRCM116780 TaxID=2907623 RepID=UPI001F1AB4AD|nr:hypothetical protein [Sphingobacterium sp. SRCM116780]UIR57400.1 hypothetical protein LZQ00_06175 [Sphingobacterium sp. SRCM116780]